MPPLQIYRNQGAGKWKKPGGAPAFGVFSANQEFFSKSARVMDSKKESIMASSLSHMGLVWQQVARLQAAGPWEVQDTAARLPSVSLRMLPTV